MERRWIWIFFSIGSFASISTLKSLLRAIILRKKNARTWKLSFFRRFSSPLRARSFRTLIGKMSLSLSLDAVSRFFPRRQHRTCKVEGYRMTSAHAVATLLLHCISSSSFAEKDDDILRFFSSSVDGTERKIGQRISNFPLPAFSLLAPLSFSLSLPVSRKKYYYIPRNIIYRATSRRDFLTSVDRF